MSTYALIELSPSVVSSLDSSGIWYEVVPDLSDDISEEPYNFLAEAAVFLSTVATAADVITVSAAVRDIGRVLKSLYDVHKETRTETVAIEVRGPLGRATFGLKEADDETIAHMAAIVTALAGSKADPQATASPSPAP